MTYDFQNSIELYQNPVIHILRMINYYFIKYLQLLYFDICDKKKRITAVMKLETDIIVSMTMSLIGEVVILVMYFKM
jgi:fumarate reductase subunit C